MNRREMIKMTGAAALGATVLGLPAVASDNGRIVDTNRRKILVIGAHPDDPETGSVNLLVGALFFPSLYFVSLSKMCIFVPNNIINNKINRLLL